MPRFLVHRTFPGGLAIPATDAGAQAWSNVVQQNTPLGVTWFHSYVSDDLETMVCVYDAPDPDAISRAADRTSLPLDRITRVTVLDPYSYMGVGHTGLPEAGHHSHSTQERRHAS